MKQLRKVEDVVEEFEKEFSQSGSLDNAVGSPKVWKPWLTTTLTQRDKELVEVIQARWNNLFGDAQNSPEEVIHQMNIFIQNL